MCNLCFRVAFLSSAVIGDGLSVPHFVIERKGGSLDIAWILDERLPLTNCIWITPQRKRIRYRNLTFDTGGTDFIVHYQFIQ